MLEKVEIRRIKNGFIVESHHEDEIPYEEVVQGNMKTVPGKEKAVCDLFKLLAEVFEVL
jgi:hypothetical protein